MAAAVSFSRWILIMASLGWAEACPKVLTGSRVNPRPNVGFSGVGVPRQPRCGLWPHPPQGVHDALLQPGPLILWRRRSPRQDFGALHPRPKRERRSEQLEYGNRPIFHGGLG